MFMQDNNNGFIVWQWYATF